MKNIGECLIGTVISVKPYALFLEFDDGSQGLLHISEISDCFIKDIENYGTVGDKLNVKIISEDPKNGFLRVSLKQVPIEERYSSHQDKIDCEIPSEICDFNILKDKLPQWINEALERTNKND